MKLHNYLDLNDIDTFDLDVGPGLKDRNNEPAETSLLAVLQHVIDRQACQRFYAQLHLFDVKIRRMMRSRLSRIHALQHTAGKEIESGHLFLENEKSSAPVMASLSTTSEKLSDIVYDAILPKKPCKTNADHKSIPG